MPIRRKIMQRISVLNWKTLQWHFAHRRAVSCTLLTIPVGVEVRSCPVLYLFGLKSDRAVTEPCCNYESMNIPGEGFHFEIGIADITSRRTVSKHIQTHEAQVLSFCCVSTSSWISHSIEKWKCLHRFFYLEAAGSLPPTGP